jgi:hypothetical protein
MDNVSGNNPNRNDSIPLDGGAGQPNRPEVAPAAGTPNISRAPLNLGTGASTPAPPPAPKAPVLRPAPPKPAAPASAGDRITTCRTFFAKLHPGALHFLDEQITAWLKDNPSIVIKGTNVITGEITEKKSEPSIVVVVWY